MKGMDNEMKSLSCQDRVRQVLYIAKEFSFCNTLLFNELMFYYYVKDVFPSVNPSFEDVSFTNAITLANAQCYKDLGVSNFELANCENVEKQYEDWVELVQQKKCEHNEPVTWTEFENKAPKNNE